MSRADSSGPEVCKSFRHREDTGRNRVAFTVAEASVAGFPAVGRRVPAASRCST